MNPTQRPRRRFGAVLLLTALVLAGCTPLTLPEGWAGLRADGTFTEGRYQNARYLYVAYRNHVFRIDLQATSPDRPSERLIDWAATPPNNAQVFGAPAVAPDGTVFMGSYNHHVYAFSPFATPRTQALTSFSALPATDRVIGDPLYANGRLYVPWGNKGLQMLDAANGRQLAVFDQLKFGIWSAPLIEGNVLYMTSLDQKLYALDANTLEYLWELDLGGAGASTPLLVEGTLYVGTFANEVLAIDPRSSPPQVLRRFKTRNWVWATPVYREGALFFADMAGYVYSLEAATFNPRWQTRHEENPGGIRGRLAVVDNMVIAPSENRYVRAYRADTGALVWTSGPQAPDRILGDALVVGDEVIVTTQNPDQLVIAYSLQNGGRNWSARLPNNDDMNRITQTPPSR